MNFKIPYKPDNIYISERENGVLAISDRSGRVISILNPMNNLKGVIEYIKRIDKVQGYKRKAMEGK